MTKYFQVYSQLKPYYDNFTEILSINQIQVLKFFFFVSFCFVFQTPFKTLYTNEVFIVLSRSFRVSRQSSRLLTQSIRYYAAKQVTDSPTAKTLAEVTGPDSSLIGKGAQPGTIPTDLDQATGLQRFEELGKMEGVDVFDIENPITEGTGSMKDPFVVPTYIGYRYVGCKGKKGEEEHKPYWMKVEVDHPGRCWQCGNVFAAKYLGDPSMGH